ncbi:hypothetical protein FZC66_09295 [Priestia megaterium]|nr:hypothetical protein FZC66_09295 [Priestia megaterium]
MRKLHSIFFFSLFILLLSACQEDVIELSKPTEPSSKKAIPEKEMNNEETNKPAGNEVQPTLPTVTKKEAEDIAISLLKSIEDTYKELGEENKWVNDANPADYDVLKVNLKQFATPSLVATKLKSISSKYYCQCNERFIPKLNPSIRFKVINNKPGQFSISAIEPMDEAGNGGDTVFMNVKYEKNRWKLNEWDEVTYLQQPLNITSEEYIEYAKQANPSNELSFIGETTIRDRNGTEQVVLKFKDQKGAFGILATSTERITDLETESEVSKNLEQTFNPQSVDVVDEFTIDLFMNDYLKNLTEAINLNQFERVQPYLENESTLYTEQQQLVKTLYERNIREDVSDYQVLEWNLKDQAENETTYEVKINEQINITVNEHTEKKKYYRIYTLVHKNNQLSIKKIESY